MLSIRKANAKDKFNMQYICLATSSLMDKSDNNKASLCALYCDYYIDNECDNCFVVADGEDNAVGYILCSIDNIAYARITARDYMPVVKRYNYKMYCLSKLEQLINKRAVRKGYIAHLHIDILPEYQSLGYGSKLMQSLLQHLSSLSIAGVYLNVDANNVKAIAFYTKFGFWQHKRFGSVVQLCKDVDCNPISNKEL